jgi:hypothetical protein
VLTNLHQYFSLPLEHHPLYCQECESILDGQFVVWKLMAAGEVVLCRRCAESIGFSLWTDALRGERVHHE